MGRLARLPVPAILRRSSRERCDRGHRQGLRRMPQRRRRGRRQHRRRDHRHGNHVCRPFPLVSPQPIGRAEVSSRARRLTAGSCCVWGAGSVWTATAGSTWAATSAQSSARSTAPSASCRTSSPSSERIFGAVASRGCGGGYSVPRKPCACTSPVLTGQGPPAGPAPQPPAIWPRGGKLQPAPSSAATIHARW